MKHDVVLAKHEVCFPLYVTFTSELLGYILLPHFLMIFLISLVGHAIVPEIKIDTFHTDHLDSDSVQS